MSGEYEEGDYYDAHGAPDDHDPFAEEDAEEQNEGDEPEPIEEEVVLPGAAAKILITGADRTTGLSNTMPMRAIMTRFEYARLIGTYSNMIDAGTVVDPRIDIKSDISLKIAEDALNFRAPDYEFPIEIYRPLSGNRWEVWRVSEMILPDELDTYGLV